MFKKIREKWNKQIEKAEKKDIKYIKKHPTTWKSMMVYFPVFYISLSLIMVYFEPGAIIFVLMIGIPIYYIEKEFLKRYKKAMETS